MKTIKLVSLAVLLLCSITAQAQFGKRLGNAVQNAAENATVRKAEQKTDEAVSKGIDKATDPNTYKGYGKDANQSSSNSQAENNRNNQGTSPASQTSPTPAAAQTPQQGGTALEIAYAKSDFVAGDEIIFEDLMDNEKLGEFPSMWDLLSGVAELVTINGKKTINFETDTEVAPLMKDMTNYLPDVFTVEFDFWYEPSASSFPLYNFFLMNGGETVLTYSFRSELPQWSFKVPTGETRSGTGEYNLIPNAWNHFALSFNQRALKVYFNGLRVTNIPSMATSKTLKISGLGNSYYFKKGITNVRIAKGAVPLYDRMMSDGKFITYGITFDVGKSTIKPESMGEINRIVTLLKENPDLKFSVEGHTDSTGSASTNQTLSEARSQAVVNKLVENGIAANRLKAAGKGQNNPIADNATDE